MRRAHRLLAALTALVFAGLSCSAQAQIGPPGGGGAATSITAGSTTATGCSPTWVIYTDASSKVNCDSGLTYTTPGQLAVSASVAIGTPAYASTILSVGAAANNNGVVLVTGTGFTLFGVTTPASGTQRILQFTNPADSVEYFSMDVNQNSQAVFDLRNNAAMLFSSNINSYLAGINSNATFNLISTGAFGFSPSTDPRTSADTILTRHGAASWQLGAADADTNAAVVAQTLRSQGLSAGGTANQAGQNWTFIASPGKGTGAGGSLIFQTSPAGSTGTALNAPVTALTIDSTKQATFAGNIAGGTISGSSLFSTSQYTLGSGGGSITFTTPGSGSLLVDTFTPGSFATLKLGSDVAAPNATKFAVQGVVGGTSNTAGANFTIAGSQGTGTGVGGSLLFQVAPAGSTGSTQNALATALTIDSTKLATFAASVSITGGNVSLGNTSAIFFNSGGTLSSGSFNVLKLGPPDVASPAAQTFAMQNVVAGTSNAAGVTRTEIGSLSTGSGVSGDMVFQTGGTGAAATVQNTAVTALTIKGATQLVGFNKHLSGIGSAPTAVASGGTGSASLSTGANDDNGTVTGGTLSTSIVITFVNAYINPPDCVISADGSVVPTTVSTASGAAGAATLTIGMAAATGAKFTYQCMGQ